MEHSVVGRADLARIVTLTMNPALDITSNVDVVRPTRKLRCESPRYDPGGGGINVARIAHVLGAPVLAVFAVGQPAGGLITRMLREAGVPYDEVPIAGSTRESFTVNETSTGEQYRFVLPGPHLTVAEQTECLDRLRKAASSAEFVVASGSLPPSVPADFYQRVADICVQVGARLILDTSREGLQQISSGVFLLKASARELRECFGCELATESELLAAAHELIETGRTEVVVVSLADQGALLATRDASHRFSAVPMPPGSGVGAGDAMVAAITVGLSRGWSYVEAVRLGIAAGAAMLMTPGTAACEREDVETLFEQVAEPTQIADASAVALEDVGTFGH